MIPPFRKVQVKEIDVQRLQDAIANVFNTILKKQIIDGQLINNILITGGSPLSVNHGLGTLPRGFIVVNKNAQSDVWQTISTTPNSTMILNANNTVTISVWVF
jgi:hypothetical protein